MVGAVSCPDPMSEDERRDLQRLSLEDPEPSRSREELGEVRRGGKVVDIERARRGKDRGGERISIWE